MFLKQSTAYTFRMGPFVDDTDGKTAETGLTIEDSHIRVSKAGANFIDKNETTNAAHDEAGFYVVILDTTDTNTVGELQIAIHISGALPVFKTFQVVEEDIYAAFFAGSATLAASVASILGDTGELQTDWANGGRLDLIIDATLGDTAELQGDWANGGRLDLLLDAALADTAELQGDWANGGRLDLLIDAILEDTGTTIPATITTIDNFLDTEIALILADTGELQTDWANGGRLDLLIDSIISKVDVVDGIVDNILVDTAEIGAAGAGLTALWTTDIVEAYAGPTETACTPAQLLYMIFSCVGSFTISSDKIITYDLPGSGSMAQAMRFDMDSTSSPTYRKRDA
jgi:hypothetical protein